MFIASALSWQPGLMGDWARTRRWHESTGRTNGFTDLRSSYSDTAANNHRLAAYLEYHLPYYQNLRRHALRIP